MEQKPELRLPTQAVRVRIALQDQSPVDAELFVGQATRTGAQLFDDVGAVLDDASPFVPVQVTAGVRLYAKHAITWVAIGHEADELALYDRLHRVNVVLVTGDSLAGTLFDSPPADRARVADHLNAGARFVRLWTQSDHYLINKSQILYVSEQ